MVNAESFTGVQKDVVNTAIEPLVSFSLILVRVGHKLYLYGFVVFSLGADLNTFIRGTGYSFELMLHFDIAY